MNTSKQFKKLPKSGKEILTEFKRDKNKAVLFASIIENLETQKTLRSKQVRLSVFRGLLRKHFGMSNEDMKPIETTTEQKQAYHDAGNAGFKRQHEDTISEELIKSIMNVSPVCKLMIQSGLRVGELLDNPFRVVKGQPEFKLNKKRNAVYHPIHIMGNVKIWVDAYRATKRRFKGVDSKGIADRINIKLKLVIPEEFYKRSTHICRAIYAKYVNRFKDDKLTLPQVISKYLNHDSPSASVYYNHVVLAKDVTDFLRTQKLIIVRGASGVGKSTYVKNTILKKNPEIKHFEADMFYAHGFKQTELSKVHRKCFNETKKALVVGHSVVVSNTSTTKTEYIPYVNLAESMGVKVEYIRIDRTDPKPTHGLISVSRDHQQRMVKHGGEVVINNDHLDKNKQKTKPTHDIDEEKCPECGEYEDGCDDFKYQVAFKGYEEDYPYEYRKNGCPNWRDLA